MWEMFTGERAYQGKKTGNIIFMVTSGKGLIEIPEDAPETYKVRPPLPQRVLWNVPALHPVLCLIIDGGIILHYYCPHQCQGNSLLNLLCLCAAVVGLCIRRRFFTCASNSTPRTGRRSRSFQACSQLRLQKRRIT